MSKHNKLSDDGYLKYRGFRIERKRDFGRFGFLIDGKCVKTGYVITDGICNILPGATWSQTIEGAVDLIDAFITSAGDSDVFWKLVRAQQSA